MKTKFRVSQEPFKWYYVEYKKWYHFSWKILKEGEDTIYFLYEDLANNLVKALNQAKL